MTTPPGSRAVLAAALVPFAAVVAALLVLAAAAAQAAPPSLLCGPAGTGTTLAGVALDAEQLANARTITAVTASHHLPPYAAVVAEATVAQESSFHNYTTHTDHDSYGLFAQRARYYTAAVATDPAKATAAFLARLVKVPNWAAIPLTDAAAAVQRPRADLAGAYARWQPLAQALVARFWPTTAAASPVNVCGITGTGHGGGTTRVPAGFTLTGSAQGDTAVRFALAHLGDPYAYGAEGPRTWDCSALTQASWAAAGVAIPRTTYHQVDVGAPVDAAQARSGDLVFIPGSDGTPAHPGHVGMVAGTAGGVRYLVQAPHTGDHVKLTPLADWAHEIVTVRRVA